MYAAWAAAGAFDRSELLKLRELGSDLEGHPTPRLSFVDVATGSLGQGICAAIGCALNARRIGSDYRTYVLLGDGESAEGSVWEAANVGSRDKLDNLCGITDVNRLGQSQPTMWQHDMAQFERRWNAFGWRTIVIDGHDMNAILTAFDYSQGMLQRARDRLHTDRVTQVAADLTRLPYADSTFDAIVCGWVLEHLPDPRPGLHELARVLQNGGKLTAAAAV